MKTIKKIFALCLVVTLCINIIGCKKNNQPAETDKNNKLTIMTTLYPYYDFVRAVVGNTPGIEVKLLIAPGKDDHSFEPTPKDIVAINKADLFIYNGGSIENWVEEITGSLDNDKQVRMRMMDYLDNNQLQQKSNASANEEADNKETERLFAVEDDDHHHEHEHGKDEHSDETDEHLEETDEHIWTSPKYATVLVGKISEKLCSLVPEYKKKFEKNSEDYIQQINKVDTRIRKIVDKSKNKEIIFADKFPLKYFAQEYSLKYYAAFPGCSGDTEPSAKTVAFLIDKVNANHVKGIFYLELSSRAMADVISEDTEAEVYQFNSCHNVTDRQFKKGVTYVQLMNENADVLEKAID